jgi:hypothetical protein
MVRANWCQTRATEAKDGEVFRGVDPARLQLAPGRVYQGRGANDLSRANE